MSENLHSDLASYRFPATAWTFIRAFPKRGTEAYREAFNPLITAYWKPIFYFLRARGYSLQDAEDLTQGFFSRLVEKDLVHKANQAQGKFRTFLLGVLKFYLLNQGPSARRQQQFEDGLVSVDALLGDEERTYEPPTEETPEAVFTRRWAAQLLQDVRERLRQQCQDEKHPTWYEVFAAVHLDAGPGRPPGQEALAAQFGLTRDQVRYALEQTKARFAQLLRARVREEVSCEEEVGEEIRELLALLGS